MISQESVLGLLLLLLGLFGVGAVTALLLLLVLLLLLLLLLLVSLLLVLLLLLGFALGTSVSVLLLDLDLVTEEQTFLLELVHDVVHDLLVLSGLDSLVQEVQTLLHLLLEGLSELGGGVNREVIDTGSDGALVGQVSGNSTLVFLAGSSDERRVEDQTVFGSLTLGLQSSEQSLLGTEDLNGRGGVLRQVGQTTGVGNELGADDLTGEGGEVGGDGAHSLLEIIGEGLAVLNQLNTTFREALDLGAVTFVHVLTHRNFGSVDDLLSFFIIKNDLLDLFFHVVSDVVSLLKREDELGEDHVIIDDFAQLGEMPREPLLQAHAEGVDVLVELLDQRDGLNNRLVLPVHVGGALLSGVAMTQTQLSTADVFVFHLLHELHDVRSDASLQLGNRVVERSREPGLVENLLAHLGVHNAEHEFLLLRRFRGGQVGSQEIFESV
uniref:Uncharacterized protein n=1 Tax=Strombidium inclinatum TaxID=197538 RepID=A0A7S3IMF5_9SPIT|mmetsp:Transcript_28679/g.43309  ORF Transcript_28679/g.43309 Transcript_28679/m.43309 type:complete len:438 (+) Transcript_28679:26-1339(+)